MHLGIYPTSVHGSRWSMDLTCVTVLLLYSIGHEISLAITLLLLYLDTCIHITLVLYIFPGMHVLQSSPIIMILHDYMWSTLHGVVCKLPFLTRYRDYSRVLIFCLEASRARYSSYTPTLLVTHLNSFSHTLPIFATPYAFSNSGFI